MATRHLVRTIVLQSLYEWDFYNRKADLPKILERNLQEFAPGIDEPEFAWRILNGVIQHQKDRFPLLIETRFASGFTNCCTPTRKKFLGKLPLTRRLKSQKITEARIPGNLSMAFWAPCLKRWKSRNRKRSNR
jgi:hypothetical protein